MSYSQSYCTHTPYREQLTIPSYKPRLLRVLDLVTRPEVFQYHFFDTPEGYSYEGEQLSGIVLVITLALNEKLTYLSLTPDEAMHVVQYIQYKSVSIFLPSMIHQQDTLTLLNNDHLHITPSVSSPYTKMLDCQTVYNSSLLHVQVAFH